MGKGELFACSKPQLKVGMAGCTLEMAKAEPSSVRSSGAGMKEQQKNLFSLLQPESISAFLSIGLQ